MTNDTKRPDASPSDAPPPPPQDSHDQEPSTSSDSARNATEGTEQAPESSSGHWQKPEGSAYAGSYRPSDTPVPERRPMSESVGEQYAYNTGESATHLSDHDHPPPEYTELPGQVAGEDNDLGANAVVTNDGRVNIRIDQKSRRLSQSLLPRIERQITSVAHEPAPPPPYVPEFLGGAPGQRPPPALNVVIQVVGSRGDVQPFIALGKVLKETYKHRVRLATHPVFKDFVTENGLEFFSIGGDPAELMAFMVKNPGLMPGFATLRSGDVGKRRKGIAEILRGTWRSCIETGDGMGPDPLKLTVEQWMTGDEGLPSDIRKPFVADAIIANPPSFGHIHCAEKLGIPLHMMFTMPWSPTLQFPHPLANIQSTNADPDLTNYMSYILVNLLTWQGLGDLINRFRKDSLGLDPISSLRGPNMLARMKIPFTYCWSPALIPKPKDWGQHISIAGFYFLDLASNYTPDPALANFLQAGEPPVYIGFGSIVVDDPNAMTRLIFDAVRRTGRRALVSKGWGGLGADQVGIPDGVFMLGNVPHDWLFQHVSAVVHHGGAGTTAAGIRAGRPTVIVPFFGDQPFWGSMTAKAGAGPPPIPANDLTAERLADAINVALKPESLERAQELADMISKEEGSQNGAQSFHQMLNYDDFRCMIASLHPAVWRVRRTQVRLSVMAAAVLVEDGHLTFNELKLFRPREYETDEGPLDPISGGASALIGTMSQMVMGVADLPTETLKLLNIHPDSDRWKGKATADSGPGPSSTRAPSAPSADSSSGQVTGTHYDAPASVSMKDTSEDKNDSHASSGTGIPRKPVSSQPATSGTLPREGSFVSEPSYAAAEGSGRSPAGPSSSGSSRASSGPTFVDRLRPIHPETAIDTGKGLGRIVGAGFKSPMDFSLNISKGFHNVPRLYGDEVRPVDKVTDLQSGMRTAAKEFGLGLYEGITGLVTDPYKGAKKEGGVGFIKGMGRGIAGAPLRVMAGAFAIPGYTMKGLYQEAMKSKGADVQNYIIAARISQGHEEAQSLSGQEREEIVNKWKAIKANIKKKKNVGEEEVEALQALIKEKRQRRREKWDKIKGKLGSTTEHFGSSSTHPASGHDGSYEELATTRDASRNGSTSQDPADCVLSPAVSRPPLPPRTNSGQQYVGTTEEDDDEAERHDLEAAIRASVSETARSGAQEDEMVAQAIRASIAELKRPVSSAEDEEEALQRALRASVEEAGRYGASVEEQRELEETLRRSLLPASGVMRADEDGKESWDEETSDEDPVADVRNDAEYQRIIAGYSRQHRDSTLEDAAAAQGNTAEDEEEFRRALYESERAEGERLEALRRQRTEEEIVMEYVKKQSLLEEEHRRSMLAGRSNTEAGASAGESEKRGGDQGKGS